MRSMRLLFAALFCLFGVSVASAKVYVHIDLATQTMHVQSSTGSYSWPVSTARAGYVTPRGTFSPIYMTRMTHSTLYNNAPMPHAIFFHSGWAIHGTTSVGQLGRPASHGCVRLAPGHAAQLYQMVQAEGATITIGGSPRGGGGARHGGHGPRHYGRSW
ncbi:MAG: L,D-transpeptidase [Methylocystis sp.]